MNNIWFRKPQFCKAVQRAIKPIRISDYRKLNERLRYYSAVQWVIYPDKKRGAL